MNHSDAFDSVLAEEFPSVSPPRKRQILKAQSFDPEFVAIASCLDSKNWQEVTLDTLRGKEFDCNILIGLLSEDAFFYYLPALLRISNQPSESYWEVKAIQHGILRRLFSYSRDPKLIVGRLNATQVHLIMQVLESVFHVDEALKLKKIEAALRNATESA